MVCRRVVLVTCLLLAAPGCRDKDTGSSDTADTQPSGDSDPEDSGPVDTGTPVDEDADGHPLATDCDDTNAAIHPEADEICDSVDNDCDGAIDEADAVDASTWYADADGDGYGQEDDSLAPPGPPAGMLPTRDGRTPRSPSPWTGCQAATPATPTAA
jgi:hypothetical protein